MRPNKDKGNYRAKKGRNKRDSVPARASMSPTDRARPFTENPRWLFSHCNSNQFVWTRKLGPENVIIFIKTCVKLHCLLKHCFCWKHFKIFTTRDKWQIRPITFQSIWQKFRGKSHVAWIQKVT